MPFRGSDDLFTNSAPLRGQFSDGKDYQPKPDFWFGLGLYNDQQLSRLKGLERSDKGIEFFSQKSLEDMSATHFESLIYKPVKSRRNAAFPWMVVEIKRELGDEKECISQAANASHTCLVLCERLAAPATVDASPIVALTSVGPEAKIFIAYKSKEDGENELHVRPTLISGE